MSKIKDGKHFFHTSQDYIVIIAKKLQTCEKLCFDHLLTLMLFPTWMTDFLLWNMKGDILKNVGDQFWLQGYNGSQWEQKLFGYRHFSK